MMATEHDGKHTDYEDASTPRLQEHINNASQDQERQLDALHAGVVRLKQHAIATNDEVVAQNDLLDHVAVQVQDTETAVRQQTQVAKKVVHAHRKLSCYYIIIMLLIIALIVVIVV